MKSFRPGVLRDPDVAPGGRKVSQVSFGWLQCSSFLVMTYFLLIRIIIYCPKRNYP